jgi:hypothetical protein
MARIFRFDRYLADKRGECAASPQIFPNTWILGGFLPHSNPAIGYNLGTFDA